MSNRGGNKLEDELFGASNAVVSSTSTSYSLNVASKSSAALSVVSASSSDNNAY